MTSRSKRARRVCVFRRANRARGRHLRGRAPDRATMLRQLARSARALAPAGEGVAARLMTTKVNQVVGAPMETYDRKVRRDDARAPPTKRSEENKPYATVTPRRIHRARKSRLVSPRAPPPAGIARADVPPAPSHRATHRSRSTPRRATRASKAKPSSGRGRSTRASSKSGRTRSWVGPPRGTRSRIR